MTTELPTMAKLAQRIADVVGRNREVFREAVRRWAAEPLPEVDDDGEDDGGVLPIPFQREFTPDLKLALLAAIYNRYAGGLPKIDPWPEFRKLAGTELSRDQFAAFKCANRYWILERQLDKLHKHWDDEGWKVVGFVDELEVERQTADSSPAGIPALESRPREATTEAETKSPAGFLGGAALANSLGIHAARRDAFFKRLERERRQLDDDCWLEPTSRRANSPQYLYRADDPKILNLAAEYKQPKRT